MFKFVHIADLHFGKELPGGPRLSDEEQSVWSERFLEALDEIKPDAVVMAGDIFDAKNPDSGAMLLFDGLLNELSNRKLYVFIVPGNHDSSIQLSQRMDLLKDKNIYIARGIEREIMHITTKGDTPVTFWLLPYVMRRRIAEVMGEEDYESYDAAFKAFLDAQEVDKDAVNIMVAHQNVVASADDKPEESGSESGFIGGVCEVMASNFDAFDYVALGHIHKSQKVGRETVRYAGCPMYYDFSEIGRNKDLTVVTVNDDKEIEVSTKEIFLPYYLMQDEGSFDELMQRGPEWTKSVKAENEALAAEGSAYEKKYYVKLLVEGDMPYGGPEALRSAYDERVVQIRRVRTQDAVDLEKLEYEALEEQTIDSLFAKLYKIQDSEGRDMTKVQYDVLSNILASQDEGRYISNIKDMKEEEKDRIIDEILKALEEGEV